MDTAKKFKFFQSKKSRCLSYDFKGGDLSSEGGLLLLREFDDKLGFSQGVSECIVDQRHPDYIVHEMEDWVCKIFRVNSKFNKRAYKPIIV